MSSSQCLAHPWLRRVPLAPPPPAPEELDVTKDNLRTFVERWSEHPDSPYVFDTTCQSICPLPPPNLFLSPSQHSLHGMSPSPCGSLSSSQESLVEEPLPPPPAPDESYYHYTIDKKGIQLPPSYVNRLLLERRASDSSCIVTSKQAGGGELSRVNLVDEIRKLSDRLFQMASQQHIPTDSAKESDKNVNNSDASKSKFIEPVPPKLAQEEVQRRNSDVPWRRSTFLAGPLSNSTSFSSKQPEEDLVRRPKFKITPFARDVPLAPPPSKPPEFKTNSANNFIRNNQISAASTVSTTMTSTVTTTRSNFSTAHSLRWGIPVPSPVPFSSAFPRTTSSSSSTSTSTAPTESTPPLKCPSSSSPLSQSAPHSPSQHEIGPEIKADLTEDFISHLLDKNRWEHRKDIMTKVVCSEASSHKGLSMEWSQVEMTMESLGQRTMKSLAKILENSTKDPKNEKDVVGSQERQTLARNLSQLGVKRLTAAEALKHRWFEAPVTTALSKKKLKRYVIKKRWIKAVNTIIALRRMGARLDRGL